MNLNIIFNKCIPESTFPLNGVKLVKKKYSNEAIERRKEKFRKLVDSKFKKSILNKTYKFVREKENEI